MFSKAMLAGLMDPLSTSDLTLHSKSFPGASRRLLFGGAFVVVVVVVVVEEVVLDVVVVDVVLYRSI